MWRLAATARWIPGIRWAAPGCKADFVLLQAADPIEAIRLHAKRLSGTCLLISTVLFCATLCALTPVGGGFFLLGWLALAWAAWRGGKS